MVPKTVYNRNMKVVGFQAHETQVRVLVDEDGQVRALGEHIGYGNLMVLAQKLWAETLRTKHGLDGGYAFAVYCCEMFLVPCPGSAHRQAEGRCDWCCGAGRVTKKVAWAMSRLEPPT